MNKKKMKFIDESLQYQMASHFALPHWMQIILYHFTLVKKLKFWNGKLT